MAAAKTVSNIKPYRGAHFCSALKLKCTDYLCCNVKKQTSHLPGRLRLSSSTTPLQHTPDCVNFLSNSDQIHWNPSCTSLSAMLQLQIAHLKNPYLQSNVSSHLRQSQSQTCCVSDLRFEGAKKSVFHHIIYRLLPEDRNDVFTPRESEHISLMLSHVLWIVHLTLFESYC